jgi:hypothetical protein
MKNYFIEKIKSKRDKLFSFIDFLNRKERSEVK